jgi:hypothetical protein
VRKFLAAVLKAAAPRYALIIQAIKVLSQGLEALWDLVFPAIITLDDRFVAFMGERYAKERLLFGEHLVTSSKLIRTSKDEEFRGTLMNIASNNIKQKDQYEQKMQRKLKNLLRFEWEEREKLQNIAISEQVIFNTHVPNVEKIASQYCKHESDFEYFEYKANSSDKLADQSQKPDSILFMVHGLHGCHSDFALLQSRIALHLPKTMIVLCQSLESKDKDDTLETLGSKLSDEVNMFLCTFEQRYQTESYRISFLGFSLGNASLYRWTSDKNGVTKLKTDLVKVTLLHQYLHTTPWVR